VWRVGFAQAMAVAFVLGAMGVPWVSAAGTSPPVDHSAHYRTCVNSSAAAYQINPRLLRAIVRVENGTWDPWSVSINAKGQSHPQVVRSYQQAVELVTRLWKQNVNFDVGLGQVNTVNMERFKVHPVSLLDPCVNLRYAARILRESIDRHGYNWTAIERYNGHNPHYPWKIHRALKELP